MSDHSHDDDDPSKTSQVRTQTMKSVLAGMDAAKGTSGNGVNKSTFAWIVAAIASVAGSVFTAAVVIYSGQISDMRDDHAATITTMRADYTALVARDDIATATQTARLEEIHDERVTDLKEVQNLLSDGLETCLERSQ